MAKHPWIHFGEATLVTVGMRRHRDDVQVDAVGFVEGGVLAGGTCQRSLIIIGRIDRTSRSAVVRASPYRIVTTNPPQQWRWTSCVTSASSSARKPRHGWTRSRGIRQVLGHEASQQVPMERRGRTPLTQPAALGLRHRLPA